MEVRFNWKTFRDRALYPEDGWVDVIINIYRKVVERIGLIAVSFMSLNFQE